MTVIAYREGIMASDSATGVGDMAIGNCRKIVRSSRGFIAAACGDAGDGDRFLEWVLEGGPDSGQHFVPNDPDLGGLFVSPDGTVRRLGLKGAPYIIEAPFHAMGIGREVAMGAMAAGATADRAVEIAIQYMDGCGGPVQMVKLHRDEAVDVTIENRVVASEPAYAVRGSGSLERALVPPDTTKRGWHWLAVGNSPPFPAKWHGDHWIVNGCYCSSFDAAKRGYLYIGECK